jgi:arabinofuranosyltransferase
LCLVLYFRGRITAAGFATGLLFMTRGEGALMLVALGVYQVLVDYRQRRSPLKILVRLAVGFLIVLVPWMLYSWVTFGAVVPNTLAAKIAQVAAGSHAPFWKYGASMLIVRWADFRLFGVNGWLVLAVPGFILACVAYRKLLVLALWGPLFAAGYTVLSAPGYEWYVLPLLYVVVVFAGLAIVAIPVRIAKKAFWRNKGWRLYAAPVAVSIALAAVCLTILPRTIPQQLDVDAKHDAYKQIAEWVNSNTDGNAKVAYVEVGYLAWYTHREVVDLLGLTRPDLLAAVKDKDYRRAFEQSNAEYLIYTPVSDFWLKQIMTDPALRLKLHPLVEFRSAAGDNYTVYGPEAQTEQVMLSEKTSD